MSFRSKKDNEPFSLYNSPNFSNSRNDSNRVLDGSDNDEHDDSSTETDDDANEDCDRESDNAPDRRPSELKEQIYHDKLANLKKQLQQLKDGTHDGYNNKSKKLMDEFESRMLYLEVTKNILEERAEREYIKEVKAAAKEYEEKKIELKKTLIAKWEDKRRSISYEVLECRPGKRKINQSMTRKLRSRGSDNVPAPVKKRKPTTQQLNFNLSKDELEADLKAIRILSI